MKLTFLHLVKFIEFANCNFSMEWMNEDTLYIQNYDPHYPDSNRSIPLIIGKEIYHENGLACKSL